MPTIQSYNAGRRPGPVDVTDVAAGSSGIPDVSDVVNRGFAMVGNAVEDQISEEKRLQKSAEQAAKEKQRLIDDVDASSISAESDIAAAQQLEEIKKQYQDAPDQAIPAYREWVSRHRENLAANADGSLTDRVRAKVSTNLDSTMESGTKDLISWSSERKTLNTLKSMDNVSEAGRTHVYGLADVKSFDEIVMQTDTKMLPSLSGALGQAKAVEYITKQHKTWGKSFISGLIERDPVQAMNLLSGDSAVSSQFREKYMEQQDVSGMFDLAKKSNDNMQEKKRTTEQISNLSAISTPRMSTIDRYKEIQRIDDLIVKAKASGDETEVAQIANLETMKEVNKKLLDNQLANAVPAKVNDIQALNNYDAQMSQYVVQKYDEKEEGQMTGSVKPGVGLGQLQSLLVDLNDLYTGQKITRASYESRASMLNYELNKLGNTGGMVVGAATDDTGIDSAAVGFKVYTDSDLAPIFGGKENALRGLANREFIEEYNRVGLVEGWDKLTPKRVTDIAWTAGKTILKKKGIDMDGMPYSEEWTPYIDATNNVFGVRRLKTPTGEKFEIREMEWVEDIIGGQNFKTMDYAEQQRIINASRRDRGDAAVDSIENIETLGTQGF